ncbi:ankyrin repeat domain-containing protein, partial [archaeon]
MASESELFKLVGASSRTPTSLLMTQLEAVLSRCKDVNERSPSNSCTALHRAASRNRVEVVKRLLKVPGIDATLVDVSGFTPLMYACKRGYSNIARLLLTTVSKVNVTDGKGNNALHLLVTAGDDVTEAELMDVSALLLKAGLNVMERNDDDKLAAELTPPTRARLRAFLRSVESVGSVPLSPLLAVAAKGDAHSLHLLLTHGFTVFDVAEDGNTALHLATLGRHTDIVKRLVECGCPLDLMNDKGETAFMIAARSNARAIAGVLEESGANTTMRTLGPRPPTPHHTVCLAHVSHALRSFSPPPARVMNMCSAAGQQRRRCGLLRVCQPCAHICRHQEPAAAGGALCSGRCQGRAAGHGCAAAV